jgi:hypothetical protein
MPSLLVRHPRLNIVNSELHSLFVSTAIYEYLRICTRLRPWMSSESKEEKQVPNPDTWESKASLLHWPLKREIESTDDANAGRKRRQLRREPYTYFPLQPSRQEIRLVMLEPSTDKTADIRCKIVHEGLNNAETIPYDALSYTWGARTDKCEQTIVVQGCDMIISRNLDFCA